MKQIARSEFGGGLSEISLNKLIIKLIKRNIRIPGGSLKRLPKRKPFFVYAFNIKYSSALLTPSSSTEEVT